MRSDAMRKRALYSIGSDRIGRRKIEIGESPFWLMKIIRIEEGKEGKEGGNGRRRKKGKERKGQIGFPSDQEGHRSRDEGERGKEENQIFCSFTPSDSGLRVRFEWFHFESWTPQSLFFMLSFAPSFTKLARILPTATAPLSRDGPPLLSPLTLLLCAWADWVVGVLARKDEAVV